MISIVIVWNIAIILLNTNHGPALLGALCQSVVVYGASARQADRHRWTRGGVQCVAGRGRCDGCMREHEAGGRARRLAALI